IERVLEAALRLAINLADRVLERGQRVRQVRVLPVQVLLALRLLAELVDRREIDLSQPLDLFGRLEQALLPPGHVCVLRKPRRDRVELETCRGKLLEQ